MDYKESAKELLTYLIYNERLGHVIQGNIAEISKGELAVIMYLIDEGDGISAAVLSKKFDINSSRVAAILNSLSKKGYIERRNDPKDKRKIQIYITQKGIEYGKLKRESILNRMSHMLEKLGEDDAREHIRIMKRIFDLINEKGKDIIEI